MDAPPTALVDPYLDFLDTLDLDAAVDGGSTQAECEAFGAALQLQQSLLGGRPLAPPEATAAAAAGSVVRPPDVASELEMLSAVGDLAMEDMGGCVGVEEETPPAHVDAVPAFITTCTSDAAWPCLAEQRQPEPNAAPSAVHLIFWLASKEGGSPSTPPPQRRASPF